MRKIILVFIVFCNLFCFSQDKLPIDFYAKIVGISDGDTFKVLYKKQEIRVRLNHIDAPELRQPYGKKAKQYASKLCFGKKVRIIRQKKRDRYNRIIAEIFLDSVNINKELVRQGYAWHFKKYSNDNSYDKIEIYARKNRKGLWKEKHPIEPWLWRKNKK